MERTVRATVQGQRTVDGAGVHLVRVLGNGTTTEYDPILMLDSFDSYDPDDYIAGFPMHPHRGIETISYVYKGAMRHRDSLGFDDTVRDGEVQWMTAGSGILHEELLPPTERMLGVQLWLNLPKKDKMCDPAYYHITNQQIPEVTIDGGWLRVLAGSYGDAKGFTGKYLPLNYYHVYLQDGATFSVPTSTKDSVTFFTLDGAVTVQDKVIPTKTAAHLGDGDTLTLTATGGEAHVLIMMAPPVKEPVAWAGPVVMNTNEELQTAMSELRNGTFIKHEMAH